MRHSPWPFPRQPSFLNSGPFPPPELLGFPGTTSLSATRRGPACPSRASGWDLASLPIGFPVLPQFPLCRHAVTITPVGSRVQIVHDEGVSAPRFPPRRRPSPSSWRVGSHVTTFEACSVFTARYGLPTRRTAIRCACLGGSDGFVTSTAAPIASGWSDQTWPGGTCTHWDTGPFHGAHELHQLSEHELSRVHASSSTLWDQSPGVDSDNPSRYRARSFIAITYLNLVCCVKTRIR